MPGTRVPVPRFFRGVADYVGARIEAELLDAEVLPSHGIGDNHLALDLGKGRRVLVTRDSLQIDRNGSGRVVVSGCLARNLYDRIDKNAECRKSCEVLTKEFIPSHPIFKHP